MAQYYKVCKAFDEAQIDYMPLKGCLMKARYPKPELRLMGDADILIRMEQYSQIIPIMESLGFEATQESDHEYIWRSKELYLELHKRLIPSYNEDFYEYYGIGWQLAHRREGGYWTMTAEDEWIFLFTHFSKHFRDGGIGCRYVADLWVYVRHNPDMDEAYIRGELQKLGLEEFHDNIRKLVDIWFGDAPDDEKSDIMTAYIFASGNWGGQESKTISVAVRDSRKSGRVAEGKLRYGLRVLFPDVVTLRDKYRVLKKAPWLLPVVWVIRPFYKLLWEAKSLRRHGENLRRMEKGKLDVRRELLEYLGITYKF
jgi:hypothetical protein